MTELLPLLMRGFIIGISIGVPVGPICVLCIRRTLADGRLTGFLSGLGAATADMIYGAIAAFSLTVVMDRLIDQAIWLRLFGAFLLFYLGLRTIRAKPAGNAAQAGRKGLIGAYFSTFALTLTNPMTILSFISIFAAALPAGTRTSPLMLVAGVFAGSAFWWLTLSLGVSSMRNRVTTIIMSWINRVSGFIMIAFAIYLILVREWN